MLKFFEKNNLLSWTLVVAIAFLIFYASSISFKTYPPSNILSLSPFYHFLVFFWFSFFLSISLVKGKSKNLLIIALFISLFYALLDEMHQLYVPGRSSSFIDFLINSSGIFFASLIYLIRLKS